MHVVFSFARCETCESVDENGDENGLRGEKLSNRPPFSSPFSFTGVTGVTVVCARRTCTFCCNALRKSTPVDLGGAPTRMALRANRVCGRFLDREPLWVGEPEWR